MEVNDLLFDVPRNKTRLEIVMEKHVIHTHDSHVVNYPDFPRWVAVLMPPCWKMGYSAKDGMGIAELYSHVGRLIDEGDLSGYGETEERAVLEVCAKNGIQIVL